MTDRQKIKYTITGRNGINIEAIGERNMKTVTEMLAGCKLRIRFDKNKK